MLIFGLKVSLIGMGIVYFSLILLVCIIKGSSILFALCEKRTRPRMPESAETLSVPAVLERETDQENGKEIAAVISAAIAAYPRNRR